LRDCSKAGGRGRCCESSDQKSGIAGGLRRCRTGYLEQTLANGKNGRLPGLGHNHLTRIRDNKTPSDMMILAVESRARANTAPSGRARFNSRLAAPSGSRRPHSPRNVEHSLRRRWDRQQPSSSDPQQPPKTIAARAPITTSSSPIKVQFRSVGPVPPIRLSATPTAIARGMPRPVGDSPWLDRTALL